MIATNRALALVVVLALMVAATPSAEAQIYSFQGTPDGANPAGGLFRDAAGNLYGTTPGGGSNLSLGTVFKVDTTGVETVLHSFDGTDGAYPMAGVIRDAAGNLYGAAMQGGGSSACDLGCGTIFKIDPTGNETVLHRFHRSDGRYPTGDLIPDAAGNLYGTAGDGGAFDKGIVFKLNRSGKLTVLYSFTGRSDGWQPRGRLARDAAGNLYGTTFAGGAYNWGTVFKLDTTGKETVLYSFNGAGPSAGGLFRDAAGNLYGTTWNGGAYNQGTVFKVDTSGTETVLYTFTGGADGREPVGPVIQDAAGNLYGNTWGGGAFDLGVVFRVDTTGAETVLLSFNGTDGANPASGLVRDPAGYLYGTTSFGGTGTACFDGCGTVFRVHH